MTHDPHVADTVQAVTRLHEEHHNRATSAQRAFGRATALMASAGFIFGFTALTAMWIAYNLLALRLGGRAFDPPPFDLLQGTATLLALYATVLILATQRRDDEIGAQREQLALQLAMLSERKLAKLIALIEEQRRDHPALRDRVDEEADAMAKPTDAATVLDTLRRE